MEVGEDVLDPLRVVQPPLDPVSTCPQQHKPCQAETNSGTPRKTSKTPLTGCQVEPPDSCNSIKLKALGPHALSHGRNNDQLECRLPWQSPRSIRLRGSSWYLWRCSSSYEHTLTQSLSDSSPGSQVPKVEIPQVVVACFLDRTPNCHTLYSMRANTSAVLPKPMLTGTHIQRPPF